MTGYCDAPYVFLGTNDPQVMRWGQRADIAPTILDSFGLDLKKFQPPMGAGTCNCVINFMLTYI